MLALEKKIQIRAAKKADIEWINQRYEEIDFIPSIFEKEVIGVAEYQGQKAGIARLVTLDELNVELGGLYVFEPYRGNGIAKELVQFLLKQAHLFQTVYCIPFEYFASFYMQYGFDSCSNLEEVPRDIVAKYHWSRKQYPKPTTLLFLQKLRYAPFPFL